MSTELKDSAGSDGPHTLSAGENWVSFYAESDGASVWAEVKKTDFIAAVETELNGIFVSRDELPEVISGKYDSELAVLDSNGEKSTMAVKVDTPESLREIGLAFLAMASYREKNPPFAVDEGQVEALAREIEKVALLDGKFVGDDQNDCKVATDMARRILAIGKITVSTD